MANFQQSRQKQFSTYIPQIDSETMAKAIAKKDTDYVMGAAKVQNTLDSVAGLPVASERDRNYLQQKVSGITSSINQKIGTDYSDGRSSNQISQDVASIANDPIIEAATQSTSNAKALKVAQKADQDENGAAATFNIQNSEDEFNNWVQNGKLGEVFKGQHFGYVDTDNIVRDAFKAKHPNTQIRVVSAGQVLNPKTGKLEFNPRKVNQMWDEEIHSWKGITPLDVKDELQGMIKERPDIQKQLEINAKYTNKELTPESIVQKKISVLKEQKDLYDRNISQIDEILGTTKPDSKDYQSLREKRKYLISQRDSIDPYLTPEAKYAALEAYYTNPDFMEQEKKSIYMDDWYNNQIKRYAYGEEGVDFKGKSPSDKQHWDADHNIKLQELQLKKQAGDRAEQKMKDAEATARAKQNKEYSAFTTSEGVTPEKTDSWTTFNSSYDNTRAELKDKKELYLYNTYHSLFPDYFTIGADKKPIPNSQQKDKLDDLYTSRYEAYKNGNNKDNSGKVVDLSRRDYEFFRETEAADRVSLAMQDKIKEAKAEWDTEEKKFISKSPEAISYNNSLNSYKGNISKDKIVHREEQELEIQNYLNNGYSLDFATKLARQYGYKDYNEFLHNDPRLDNEASNIIGLKQIVNKTVVSNKQVFLNNYLEANDYVVNPQSTQWVDLNIKDPKTNDVIRQRAVKLLKGVNSPILSSKNKDENIAISYVQEPLSGNYTMKVEDTKGQHEEYPVAPTDAPAEWKNYKDESTLSQLLRVNRNPYTKLSNTYDNNSENSHTFKDALPLTNKEYKGKPTAIKYHVVQEGGNYYVEFWAKDITNPNDQGHILRDPKSKVALEASTTSLKELHLILDNFSKTGNINPVGFSSNLKDEEEDNQD